MLLLKNILKEDLLFFDENNGTVGTLPLFFSR